MVIYTVSWFDKKSGIPRVKLFHDKSKAIEYKKTLKNAVNAKLKENHTVDLFGDIFKIDDNRTNKRR